MQVCGVLGGRRLDEVASVFQVSSRINSTWGGNLVDMVRGGRYLQVIEADGLMENATAMGERFLCGLDEIAKKNPTSMANVRGRGSFTAFTLSSTAERNRLMGALSDDGMLAPDSSCCEIPTTDDVVNASATIDNRSGQV